MTRYLFAALFLLSVSQLSAQRYILKSSFADSPVPPAPDYHLASSWCSLPDKKDPADSVPDPSLKNNQAMADIDVFFVHPTTFTYKPQNQYKWNADVGDQYLNDKTDYSTILYQASVFNGSCRIYAPRYRQAHISAFYASNRADRKQALDLAYTDVKNAFQYYLEHYNNGRPIIIASHSQGTIHAAHLLMDFFAEGNLKNKLVVAYLVGMPINPDSLKFIVPCTDSNSTGCYCTWNTFAEGFFPKYYKENYLHAICNNPLSWTTTNEYCEDTLNKGSVLRPFGRVVDHACDARVHDGLLWINKPHLPFFFFYPIKIYHVADYNLFYMNIRENVQRRINLYWKG